MKLPPTSHQLHGDSCHLHVQAIVMPVNAGRLQFVHSLKMFNILENITLLVNARHNDPQ